jgi:hypothetical protein
VQDGRSGVNQVADRVKKECVAVAINGHMLSWLAKTDGADGEFIKANRHPSGGNCFVLATPDGKKLAGGNGSGGASAALTEGMGKWKLLSDAERHALPAGKPAVPPEAARCTPPPGGLILTSYLRNLKRDDRGELARITRDDLKDRKLFPDWNPIYTEPAHYSVWLTESEWKSLVPQQPRVGDSAPIPDGIQKRLIRYHLVNGTFGLPGAWRLEDIRSAKLDLKVANVAPAWQLELTGSVLLASDADLTKAQRGYDAELLGTLEIHPIKKTFTRFEMVALGDYWGGDYEGGRFKRPGRTPLGIVFELAAGKRAVERVPPLVHMDRKEAYDRYFAAEQK